MSFSGSALSTSPPDSVFFPVLCVFFMHSMPRSRNADVSSLQGSVLSVGLSNVSEYNRQTPILASFLPSVKTGNWNFSVFIQQFTVVYLS